MLSFYTTIDNRATKLNDRKLKYCVYFRNCILSLMFLLTNFLHAQQIIGVFPEMNGSFSLQPDTLANISGISGPQIYWTTQVADKGIVRDTGGRSDDHYLEFEHNSTTNIKRMYSSTVGTKFKRNTTYTIQFYMKGDMDGDFSFADALRVGISPNGTNNIVYSQWLQYPDFPQWEMMAVTLTTADVAETNGVIVFEAVNNRLFYFDDFVVYPDTFDYIAPLPTDTMIVNNTTLNSINISWTPPQWGLDSGGYMLVRFKDFKPDDDDDPNERGIYNVGDTIQGIYGNGVIIYMGTDTNYFDNNNLNPATSYWYKLYVVDKAFNYSEDYSKNAYTLNTYPEIEITQSIQDFGLVQVGSSSVVQNYTVSSINLIGNLLISAPDGFQVSNYPGSGFSSTLEINQVGGIVPDTTVYIRFTPLLTGYYSPVVSHTTPAGYESFQVTGIGHKNAPTVQASLVHCIDVGSRSMNVRWTKGNGDTRMVKVNSINSFTNPVDSTSYAANPLYTSPGEQVVYKGSDSVFNIYGLNPQTSYWFRVYEYNNMDTLTKYLSTTYTLNPNTCQTGAEDPFFEDFEQGDLVGYFADTTVQLESGKWRFAKSTIGTTSVDKKRGAKSARIQLGGYIVMDFNKPKGIESISLYHGNYRNDQGGRFVLQYSTNNGQSFHPIGFPVNCNSNGQMQKITFDSVNIQGPVRFLIQVINGNRVNIDDISISDFVLTTWTGYADTVWHNHDNWSYGIPDSSKSVLIPAVPQGNPNNFPVVTAPNGVCLKLTIENGGKLTINPNASLTVEGKMITRDSLKILSSDVGHGSLITYDTIIGNAKIYQYNKGSNRFNAVGVPMAGATSIVYDAASGSTKLEYFTQTTGVWTEITNNTTTLTPLMRGYNYRTTTPKNVLFNGKPNNFGYNIELSRNPVSSKAGFNFIANPYPSGIDFNSDSLQTDFLVHKTYWMLQNQTFSVYNGNAKIGIPRQVSNLIPPMQGFFVKLDTPFVSKQMVFNNYVRKHHTDAPDTSVYNPMIFRIKTNQQGQSFYDEIAIAFFNSASDTLDVYDSQKLFSIEPSMPQIYTMIENDSISINSNAELLNNISFPLGFKTTNTSNFTFEAIFDDYDKNFPVFLEDKVLSTMTDLRADSLYNFSNNPVNDTNRFVLHFFPCFITPFDFTTSGIYCENSGGVDIQLNGSEINVNYQLYKNGIAEGSPISGTGFPLTWNNMTQASYTVVANSSIIQGCYFNFTDTAVVEEIPLPAPYILEPVTLDTYCDGTSGTELKISSSETNTFYQLYKNNSVYGSPVSGNGSELIWDSLQAGSYYLLAITNTSPQCQLYLSDTVNVTMLAAPTVFTLTGSGDFCEGDGGWLELSDSEIGKSYQLKKGPNNIGSAYTGTGNPLTWSNIYVAGDYYVIASDDNTLCTVSMSDTISINEIPSPTAYNLFGGGTFCDGQGVLGLENSQTFVYYQLIRDLFYYEGAPVLGTGDTIYWNNLGAGLYQVEAYTNSTPACEGDMMGLIQIDVTPAPTVYNVSSGGSYCPADNGVSVFLNGSANGFTYQLYKNGVIHGNVVNGTGLPLAWHNLLAGTYTVIATDMSSPYCWSTMNGTAVVEQSQTPVIYQLSGGGSYCAGGSGSNVILNNSQTGVTYQLYLGGNPVGSAVAGTGSQLEWTNLMGGTYIVMATMDAAPNCAETMTGSITITEVSAPIIYNFIGSGSYCVGASGLTATLVNSQSGVNYQLYKDGVAQGTPVTGTGNALPWNNLLTGAYTIVATIGGSQCSSNMNGSVVISQVNNPSVFNLSGGGSYCSGSTLLSVTLSGSQTGVNYQLFKGGFAEGSANPGTGNQLVWNNLSAGTYTVVATMNSAPYCTSNMTGSVLITMVNNPTVFNLSGGGSYCSGGTLLSVTLSGSQIGVNYQLYKGGVAEGSVVPGTGNQLIWNNLAAGTYNVIATMNSTPFCTSNMTGSVLITMVNNPTVFNLSGGGSYCSGGSLLSVTLSGSQIGVNYQLFKNGIAEGSVVSGTGNQLVWSNLSAGTYTVVATMTTSPFCSSNMIGSIVITQVSNPAIYNLTSGGNYCQGTPGSSLTLSDSDTGVNYQLYKNSLSYGSTIPGTGNQITWNFLTAGTYTVVATMANAPYCSSDMTGSIVIAEVSNPTVFNLSGGGSYCAGGTLLSVTLSGSQTGVNYQLFKDGIAEGSVVPGTATQLIWNNLAAGTYTVVATLSSSPYCISNMLNSIVITEITNPTIYTLSGNGNYCQGTSGSTLTLSDSDTGVNYQLFKNSTAYGSFIAGTGNPIVWNNLTAGTYSVVATLVSSPYCSSNMSGNIVVAETPLQSVNAGIDQNIVYGSSTTITAIVSGGSGNFTYQWQPSISVISPNSASTSTATLLVNTQFIVYVTDVNTTCIQSDTVLITVFGGPLTAGAQANPTLNCEGDTVALSAIANGGTGSYTYSWSSIPSGFSSNSPSPIAMPTVNTTYTVLINDGNSAETASVSVMVTNKPDIYFLSGDGSYCIGGSGLSVFLSNSQSNVFYQLYQNGVAYGQPIPGVDSTLIWTGLPNGTYTVSGSFDYSPYCTALMSGSVVITTTPNPSVFNLSGGGSYCQGGTGLSVSLNSSVTGVNYQLFRNGVAYGSVVSGTGTTLTWNNLPAGNYTATASLSSSPFCSSNMTGTVVITEVSGPTVYLLSGGGGYCAGTSGLTVILSNSQTSASYQLFKNSVALGSAVNGTGSSLSWTNLLAGTYTVVATLIASPNCTSNMNGSINIYENPLPIINAGNNQNIFYGTSTSLNVTVSGGGSYTYGWTPASSVVNPTAQTTMTQILYNTTEFIVLVTNTNTGCSQKDTVIVSVSGTGLAVTPSGQPSLICPGDTFYLNAVATGGSTSYSYAWSSNPAGFTSTSASTYHLPSVNTTYTVIVNDGYNVVSGQVSVNVGVVPQVFNLSSGGNYCHSSSGVSITLNGSQTGVNYQLYKNGSVQGMSLAGTGFSLTWDNQLAGSYSVTATSVAAPYCSIQMSGTAVINQYPQTPVTFNPVGNFCNDDDEQLLNGSPLGGSFSGTGVNAGYFYPVNTTPGVHVLSYTITDANSCIESAQQSVTIYGLPVVNISTINDICISESPFLLTGGVPLGGYYQGNGIFNDTLYPDSLGAGLHDVTYWYMDAHSCSNSDTASIRIYPFPAPYTLTTNGQYCPGTNGTSLILNSSENGVSYQLYKDGVAFGNAVSGSGNPITWDNLLNGQYYIWGFYPSATDCETFMNNIVMINESTPPSVYLGSDTTLCLNQNIELAAHVGYTYFWIKLPSDTLDTINNILVDYAMNGLGTQSYVIVLIDQNNCISTDTINITFDNCVGIHDSENALFMVYPNPSSNKFTVSYKDLLPDNYTISISNMLSQVMIEKQVRVDNKEGTLEIDIRALSKGVYNLSLRNQSVLLGNIKVIVN
ncbi:MAG: hypothetical protein PHT69_04610 [Bacteroidales bacterium]|nr:hypothetical protein [Bacteroidales bacterium]